MGSIINLDSGINPGIPQGPGDGSWYLVSPKKLLLESLPLVMEQVKTRSTSKTQIKIRQHPDPDPDLPDLNPANSGSGSGKFQIWIRFCRIQIRQYPELDPFWPDLDLGSSSKDMIMDPFRLYCGEELQGTMVCWCTITLGAPVCLVSAASSRSNIHIFLLCPTFCRAQLEEDRVAKCQCAMSFE